MSEYIQLAQAALGAVSMGFVPIVVWLVFWLFEDWRHPEPRQRLLMAFLIGMCAVIAVLPLQKIANDLLPLSIPLLFIWASIEELMKFLFASAVILWQRSVDEPIDFPIYMITVALGFAAVENSLFLFSPLYAGNFVESAITGDLRFIGATLIHILGSAIIGGALALTFYRSFVDKVFYTVSGVILACVLHAFFNFLIIQTEAGRVLTVFLGVWVAIIFMLLVLERIKLIHRPAWWEKIFTGF